jgi:peptide/nickel transport system substrate-binding protein
MTQSKQMSDPRVRQAVNFAFDRKTLLETVFQGAGRLLWIDAGFDPNDPALEHYDYNPDKAKQLLADAAKDGKYDPNSPSGSSSPPSRPAGTRSPRRSTPTSTRSA